MKLIDADRLRQAILTIMPERSEVLLVVDAQPDVFSLLNEQRAVKPQTESAVYDTGSWWYVCGACQQPIDKTDIFCRHCGKRVKWE